MLKLKALIAILFVGLAIAPTAVKAEVMNTQEDPLSTTVANEYSRETESCIDVRGCGRRAKT